MNIKFLYLVYDFPPVAVQPGIRALEISKRLVKKNIFPTILTRNFDKKMPSNKFLSEIPSSLDIFRTPFIKLNNNKINFFLKHFFRFDFYLEWIPFAYLKAKKILKTNKEIKFIYASGPPFYIHIIGYLLNLKFKIPLIVEYRDPWSFNPYFGKNEQWLNKKIDLIFEKRILNSAEIIITVSPALSQFLKEKFPFIRNKPIYSIANGLNINKFHKNLKENSKDVIFTFTGNLYQKRTIIPLLTIISKLKNEYFFEKFNFQLKIFGTYNKNLLSKIINKLKIDDLILLGDFIPRSKVFNEISKSDLALHVGENLNYPTIAFKVWDYLSCRKKILYLGLEKCYTAQFLEKNNLGYIIPINNLKKGKLIFKNLIFDILNNRFEHNIDHVLSEFSWDNRVKILINIIKKKFVK